MARYKVSAPGAHAFIPGIGRVRSGQIVEGSGLEKFVGTLLVEVPDSPGKPLEFPKVESAPPLEMREAAVPLETPSAPDSVLTEDEPRRGSSKRRAR